MTPFTAASVVRNVDGSFSVLGGHTYAEEGTYNLKVTIHDAGGATTTAGEVSFNVQDAALSASTTAVTLGGTFGLSTGSSVLATFTDPGNDGTAADYSGSIAWGDATTTFTAADIRIQQYGNTAIVAFRLVGTTEQDGKTDVANYLNTGTFLKRGGRWQVVSWQATRLPRP